MLKVNAGHSVDYYVKAVTGGREGYYVSATNVHGEPPGRWYGTGAEMLGLTGEIDPELLEAIYSHKLDPRDRASRSRSAWGQVTSTLGKPDKKFATVEERLEKLLAKEPNSTPERRVELQALAEAGARQAVSFEDITYSVQKSVTVLAVAFERAANEAEQAGDLETAAAYQTHLEAVEQAVMEGARASIDYLQDVAGVTRVGRHGGGAGRWADTNGWTVGQFLQHDSRDHDPQLHVHQIVLNRVQREDGEWGALDGQVIRAFRGTAAAIAERVTEVSLTNLLGIRFETRPDGKAREILGISKDVLDLFSSRRRAITPKTQELIRQYEERHSRPPSNIERAHLAQQATLLTRKSKSADGESRAEALDRWEGQIREKLSTGLADVARMVLDRRQQIDSPATWDEDDVIDRARAALTTQGSSWSRSDLTAALDAALPGHLGIDPTEVRELLERLTDKAMAQQVQRLSPVESTEGLDSAMLRKGGQSPYDKPGAAKFAFDDQLGAERELQKAAVERGADRLTQEEIDAVLDRYATNGRKLGESQAAAVRGIATSGARVETLVAAAGAGKSFTMGPLAEAWTGSGRRVFGLGPSQKAAQVLAGEGIEKSTNVDRWLGAQRRLDATPAGRSAVGGDEAWRLRSGDLVILDEAGMARTDHVAEVYERARAAGAKVLLTGDPRQLAAVGPGGALADIAERGLTYHLAEVRRFQEAWEGPASLRLRDGDTTVLAEYSKRGRLREGGTAEQTEAGASRAWLADTLAGKNSLLLVGTNEQAARVSAQLRAELVRLGRVQEHGVTLEREGWQGITVGVGDRIQARHNAWHLAGYDGNTQAPVNRDNFEVLAIRDDGGLRVRRTDRVELSLPGDYVRQNVELAYCSTTHGGQGATVDTAHAIVGTSTDSKAAYVAGSRGREGNTFWTITRKVAADADTGETHDVHERSARAVLADILGFGRDRDDNLSATTLAEREAEAAKSVMVAVNRLAEESDAATAGRVSAQLDMLAVEGTLSENDRTRFAIDPATQDLDKLMRTAEVAGHDPAAVLRHAVERGGLASARSVAQVLHSRITESLRGRLTPALTSARDLIPRGVPEAIRKRLEGLADAADDRRRELGERAAADKPQWAIEALGDVPEDVVEREEWAHRAGWGAAYRELSGHNHDTVPLGVSPGARLAEHHSLWHAAHRALDLPEAGAEEGSLTNGALRARVRAYERQEVWGPAYVGDQLEQAYRVAQDATADAELWAARAAAATTPEEAEQLRAASEEARAKAAKAQHDAELLEAVDGVRAEWYEHTAPSREMAERSRTELESRGVDIDDPAGQVTTYEWLEAERQARQEDDVDRDIVEEDLADDDQDVDALGASDAPEITADLGEMSADEPEDMRATVAKAQEALARVRAEREQNKVVDAGGPVDVARWEDEDVNDRDTAKAAMS
ncbi:MobF family relaxase [Pseudonocardia sp. CA-142604]|uniref:MobF family relaxase n=1 Tax=Pseudonocardia sp. CA-142604 TaxID=3240024 RepID=UPI003D8E83C3